MFLFNQRKIKMLSKVKVKMTKQMWGFPASSLFQHVLKFYRREKEHVRLEYSQRVELLALFKQVKLGPYAPDKDTDTGYFDVVGADRRKSWKALGDTSQEDAQVGVIRLLEGVCPQLKEVVLNDYKEAKGQQQQQRTEKSCLKSEQANGGQGELKGNEQMDIHFKSTSPDSRSVSTPDSSLLSSPPAPDTKTHPALAPAALWWSPKSARNFIAQLRLQSSAPYNPSGALPLTLAAGENVSVQVPTSAQASAIFWEFVTEHGDIGFGLSFQRSEGRDSGDVTGSKRSKQRDFEQLLPVTLKDCSEDLVLGSHQYQDEGLYTLDFVNSHSSAPKVVYYRVFYQNSVS